MYVDGAINVDNLTKVEIDEKEFLKNRVEHGDIFFTRSSIVKEGIAYSNVNLNKADDLTFDRHLIRMRPIKKEFSPIFLNYNFATSNARKQFIKRGKKLIENYLFAEREPLRDEELELIEGERPSLLQRKKLGDRILKRITDFVETFINGMTTG